MHLAAKVDVDRRRGRDYAHANVDGHPPRSSRACRAAGVAPAGARLVPVGGPRRVRPGRRRRRAGRPGAAPAATTPGARPWPSGSRWRADASRPGRRRDPPAPGLGARRHPAGRAASCERARAGRLPVIGSGAALIDTHLRRQRRRRRWSRPSTLRARRTARRWWSPTASRGRSPSSSPASAARPGSPAPRRRVPYAVAWAAGAAAAPWAAWRGDRAAGRATRRSPGSWPSSWPPRTGSTSGAPARLLRLGARG